MVPEYQTKTVEMFAEPLDARDAQEIERADNDSLMTAMPRDFGTEFRNENTLFANGVATETGRPKSAASVLEAKMGITPSNRYHND